MHIIENDKQEKIWHGPKPEVPMFHPDCSVGRVLFNLMKLHGKSVAQIHALEDINVTYEDLLMGSIRIAQNFKRMKLQQDDIVGILSRNVMFATQLLLACWFNATPFHTINPVNEEAVVEHLFGITRPKLIFCEGHNYKKVLQACKNLKLDVPIYTINNHVADVPRLDELMQSTNTEQLYRPENLKHGGHQTIAILNSSGSTGLPKAVCMSNTMLLMDFPKMLPIDVLLSFAALDAASCIHLLVVTLMCGSKRIIPEKLYEPGNMLDMVEKYSITYVALASIYIAELVSMAGIEKRDLSSIRCLSYVGERMSLTVFQKIRGLLKDPQRQKIINNYAFTEVGIIIAARVLSDNGNSGVSGLSLYPGIKVKIIDEANQTLNAGETGEIIVHSGKQWNGYYNNPEETMIMSDANGWYHTGDLGYIDENGDLFIVDRKKNVMKYLDHQVFPGEIEEVIYKLPDVVEVCVFGNAHGIQGDRVAAAIVRRLGSKLTEEQVIEYVASEFEVEWKRLHGGVYFMESFPRTGTGKIKRSAIKELLTVSKSG